MEKYLFKNWATFPFKRKSFDGQMDRYLKVCVVSIDNPTKVLDIIPIYGNENSSGLRDIINLIYNLENGVTLYGLCSEHDVWKPERDINGKVIEYNSMRVFTMSLYDSDFGVYNYANGWFPSQMYYKYFGYRYLSISQLTEPIQM